jgi:hypothetical protein
MTIQVATVAGQFEIGLSVLFITFLSALQHQKPVLQKMLVSHSLSRLELPSIASFISDALPATPPPHQSTSLW